MDLPKNIIKLFSKQQIAIVSSFDEDGHIHCAVKGICDIKADGRVFVVDLYLHNTFLNIKRNPNVSVTVVDEHSFSGFTLKGKAKILERDKVPVEIMNKWDKMLVRRISSRVIKSVQSGVSSFMHHEAVLPDVKYLIEVDVKSVVDLAPANRK